MQELGCAVQREVPAEPSLGQARDMSLQHVRQSVEVSDCPSTRGGKLKEMPSPAPPSIPWQHNDARAHSVHQKIPQVQAVTASFD